MRYSIPALVQIIGASLITVAFAMVNSALGIGVAGLFTVIFGIAAERGRDA